MPSCVVKWCKNNSITHKKADGITFHFFPKDLDRRKKWIEIIRTCRKQYNWVPSERSIICSAHFEDIDLYTTKKGFRRVARNSIPKKVLAGGLNIQNSDLIQSESSIECQNVQLDSQNVVESSEDAQPATSIESQEVLRDIIKTECCDVSSNNSHLCVTPDIQEQNVVEFSEDARPATSIESQEVCDIRNTEYCDVSNNYSLLYVTPVIQESTMQYPVYRIPNSEIQPILDSSVERLLTKQIETQKDKIISYKKKIRSLNQKLRRFQNKNKSLKYVIKNLKTELSKRKRTL